MEDMEMILMITFLIVIILTAIGIYVICGIWKKKKTGSLTVIDNVIVRNSGYGEQSTKNFTAVPFRVSEISSSASPRSSQNSTLKGSVKETETGDIRLSGKQQQKHNTFPLDATFIQNEKEIRTLR